MCSLKICQVLKKLSYSCWFGIHIDKVSASEVLARNGWLCSSILVQKKALVYLCAQKKRKENIVAGEVFQCSFQNFILTKMDLLNLFHPNFHPRVSSLFVVYLFHCTSCLLRILWYSRPWHKWGQTRCCTTWLTRYAVRADHVKNSSAPTEVLELLQFDTVLEKKVKKCHKQYRIWPYKTLWPFGSVWKSPPRHLHHSEIMIIK